jgi:hypothetical protein
MRVRVRVAVAFGRPATPPQVRSIEAVPSEVAVDQKLGCTPVRMKLGGIARAAPATKQSSNNADPPSGSPAHSWLEPCLVVRGLVGCDREVSKLHSQKVATPARLLKRPPSLNFDAEAVGRFIQGGPSYRIRVRLRKGFVSPTRFGGHRFGATT